MTPAPENAATSTAQGRALIRCDGSARLGSGHVFRTGALASELARRGWTIRYAARDLVGAPLDRILRAGHALSRLPAEISESEDCEQTLHLARESGCGWIVVDRYATPAESLERMAAAGLRVLALDDLCSHAFPVSILVNAGLHASRLTYATRADTQQLLGTRFALVRRVYKEARPAEPREARECRRVLVCLGGGDVAAASAELALALSASPGAERRELRVVVGSASTGENLRARLGARARLRIEHDLPDLAEALQQSDLLVTAGGGLVWEACCLGVPMAILPLADNQVPNAHALHEIGAADCVGSLGLLGDADSRGLAQRDALAAALQPMLVDDARRLALARKAWSLVDGRGAERVADAMQSYAS